MTLCPWLHIVVFDCCLALVAQFSMYGNIEVLPEVLQFLVIIQMDRHVGGALSFSSMPGGATPHGVRTKMYTAAVEKRMEGSCKERGGELRCIATMSRA